MDGGAHARQRFAIDQVYSIAMGCKGLVDSEESPLLYALQYTTRNRQRIRW